jgi:hypothetical protein
VETVDTVVAAFDVDGSRLVSASIECVAVKRTAFVPLFLTATASMCVLHGRYERLLLLLAVLRDRRELGAETAAQRVAMYGHAITHSIALAAAMLPRAEGGIASTTQARAVIAAARCVCAVSICLLVADH